MRIVIALTALIVLAACANTRAGIATDAERMGDKTQEIGRILAAP